MEEIVRIDDLPPAPEPSLEHMFPAMKEGKAAGLTGRQLVDLVQTETGTGQFLSPAAAAIGNSRVPATVNIIAARGVDIDGDEALPYFRRVGAEPSHPLKRQSLDGAWWEQHIPRGALSANEMGMLTKLSAADTVLAWNDANAFCVAKGVPLVIEPGFRKFNSALQVGNGVRVMGLDRNFTRFISTAPAGAHAVVVGGPDAAHRQGGGIENMTILHNDVATGGPGKGTTAAKGVMVRNTARNMGVLRNVGIWGFGAVGLELDGDFTLDRFDDVKIIQCAQSGSAQANAGLVMNSGLTPYAIHFHGLSIEESGFFGIDYASSAYGGAVFGYMGATRKGSITFDESCVIQGNFGQAMVYLEGFGLVRLDAYLELTDVDQSGEAATVSPQFLASITNSKVDIGGNYRGSERSLSAVNRALSITGGSYVELRGGLDDGDFVGTAEVKGSILRIPRSKQLNAGTVSGDDTSAVLTGDHAAKARFSTGSAPAIVTPSENIKSITRAAAGTYDVEFKRPLKPGWQGFANAEDLAATGPLSASVRHTWSGTADAGCSVYTHAVDLLTDFNTMDLIVFGEFA